MSDPSDQMLAVLRSEIGRLVMENAALKARAQALEQQLKELRPQETPPAVMNNPYAAGDIPVGAASRNSAMPAA